MLDFVHRSGRRAILAFDAAFNRCFGEKLNPLYFLGAISYFMFWIAVVSGLYVYVFYETGVDTTFASVERLTHGQWIAGGLMRSLHRYASDAMVLTMLLHLGRNFFFDRYRGFRAFSWITGVVLLWLVYASGVNGYMLPWDRLAQYVTVTTAEWFDALPAFRGTMVRNFLLPEGVSDRLFSLLSFLHIGVPLAALATLWIHTQRVPRARTMPPRPLALGLVLMLLALSLAKPAVSQGPADFMRLQSTLGIDWLFLAPYPAITAGHAVAVWWLVGGVTVVLLLAPWLPPVRRAAGREWTLDVHPGNHRVAVRAGETLLDAGLRAQLALPFECRSGGCGVCRAALLAGEVDAGAYQPSALSAEDRARGQVLLCCATARSDVEIELETGAASRERDRTALPATVTRLTQAAHDVMLVELTLDQGHALAYDAGQYLNIVLDDGERRSYSFTEPSATTGRFTLHIRRVPGGRFSTQVFETMRVGDRLRVEGPFGAFVLREDVDKPLIFVAGATGFAPVKSLLEQAFRAGVTRPLYLYWGVRERRDLYMADLPERWQREHPNFTFVPVLSEAAADSGWHGRTGLVHQAILQDFPDLAGAAIYACGSLQLVRAATPAFVAQGLPEEYCYSDVLAASGGR
jgi:NAD(P)H-flavin reductase/ferredoxin